MNTNKPTRIIYWVATTLIFLFEGVLPALTSRTQLAIEGIRHLGYSDSFGIMLTIFKVSGAIVLIVPAFKGKIKEWAYAGFSFVFISAAISHWAVDGFTGQTIFPLVVMLILLVSYYTYYKLQGTRYQNSIAHIKI